MLQKGKLWLETQAEPRLGSVWGEGQPTFDVPHLSSSG